MPKSNMTKSLPPPIWLSATATRDHVAPDVHGVAAARHHAAPRPVAWRNSQLAILHLDTRSGKVVDANAAAGSFFGYPYSEIVGMDYRELIAAGAAESLENLSRQPDGAKVHLPSVEITQQSKATHCVEIRASAKSGCSGVLIAVVVEAGRHGAAAELRRMNWALSATAMSSSALTRSTSLQDVMANICEAIVGQGVYVLAAVWLTECGSDARDADDGVKIVAAAGPAIDYLDGLKVSASEDVAEGRGAIGRALRSGIPQIIRDTGTDAHYAPWRDRGLAFGLRSTVAVPFRKNGGIVGALQVYACEPDAFGPKEMNIFQQLGNEVALAMTMDEDRRRIEASERAQREAEARAEKTRQESQEELLRVARISLMGEFAAEIAHEISQPLGAMRLNAGTLLRWLNREPPALTEARKAVERLMRDIDRAVDVVKRTRQLYAKGETEYAAVDLAGVLEDVLAMTLDRRDRSDISVRLIREGSPRPVLGDRIQLQQVVFNLMLNAFESMEEIADRPRCLQATIGAADAAHAFVEIQDSGAGLDAEIAERLFERFVTTKPSGTGMGLAICRSIVEAHGGKISASPVLPFGATFRFTVPTILETVL